MVMGCDPLGKLLVVTSIKLPVEASSLLTSSSWIHSAGKHLFDPLLDSVLATLLLLIVVVGLSFVVYIVTKRHETAVAFVDAELAFSVADAADDDAAAVVATAELLAVSEDIVQCFAC